MSKRKPNRSRKNLAALLLCLLFLLCSGMTASAETLSELRDRQAALEAEKESNDKKLEDLKNDTVQKKAYRDALYEQIETLQNQLDLLRQQIDDLNKKVGAAEDAIAEKQTEINKNMDLLRERVKALYMTGEAPAVALVLNSSSLMDYTEKLQALQSITAADQELIDTLKSQMDQVEDELALINADKAEVGENKKALERKSAELGRLYEEAQFLVAEAENTEAGAAANSEILGSQIEDNEAAIAELEEQLRQESASGGGSGISGGGYTGTGSFCWPMPGYTYLTCYYGEGGHRGIDIAGGDIYGKEIVAADSGTVQYAGWNDSYGYCVFIDHGNGYQTRYAHMSALGTDTGASVGQGQVIGYVGSTGNSTGPHLHFEVILNDSLTNPMGYF